MIFRNSGIWHWIWYHFSWSLKFLLPQNLWKNLLNSKVVVVVLWGWGRGTAWELRCRNAGLGHRGRSQKDRGEGQGAWASHPEEEGSREPESPGVLGHVEDSGTRKPPCGSPPEKWEVFFSFWCSPWHVKPLLGEGQLFIIFAPCTHRPPLSHRFSRQQRYHP